MKPFFFFCTFSIWELDNWMELSKVTVIFELHLVNLSSIAFQRVVYICAMIFIIRSVVWICKWCLNFSLFQVTRLSRKNVCFVMFMDEVTLQTLASEGQVLDRMGFIGLWKVVVVKNLPYSDMRRVGKIPKLLPHRLFPSARWERD